jgi:hypothetical protein
MDNQVNDLDIEQRVGPFSARPRAGRMWIAAWPAWSLNVGLRASGPACSTAWSRDGGSRSRVPGAGAEPVEAIVGDVSTTSEALAARSEAASQLAPAQVTASTDRCCAQPTVGERSGGPRAAPGSRRQVRHPAGRGCNPRRARRACSGAEDLGWAALILGGWLPACWGEPSSSERGQGAGAGPIRQPQAGRDDGLSGRRPDRPCRARSRSRTRTATGSWPGAEPTPAHHVCC